MRYLTLAVAVLLVSCGKDSEPPASQGQTATAASPRCVVELSADKSKYFETAQRLGADFSKLAKIPFSAGLENQVKSVVADSFQTIQESNVRCMIVAKLQACAIDAKNEQLAARMQETVEKTCAGITSSATAVTSVASNRPATNKRQELWACIPPGRRGAATDLSGQDPTSTQLGGGVLYWSSKADSQAIRCVEALASAGGDPNFTELEPEYQGYFGGPPLHLALSHKRWDMAEVLLRLGADPRRRSVWKQQTASEVAHNWGAPDSMVVALNR